MSWAGYWLRRPEPSIVVGILATVWFVVLSIVGKEPWILLGSAPVLGATVWIWLSRGTWRDNADRARRGDRPFV